MVDRLIVTFSNAGRVQTKVVLFTGATDADAHSVLDDLDVVVRTAVLCRAGEPNRTLIKNGVTMRESGWATERMKWADHPSVWRNRVLTWLPTSPRAAYV